MNGRRSGKAPRARLARARGFTLLELLVAVTLMSVLALMSWRALDALIDARERISRSGDDLRALVVAFAQVEEDLRRAWPVRLVDTGRSPVVLTGVPDGRDTLGGGRLDLIREAPAVAAAGGRALAGSDASAGGRTSFDSGRAFSSGLQRVVWRLESGRLERGFVSWWPGDPEARADSDGGREVVWQVLVDRVEAVGWRIQVPGRGWMGVGQRVDASEPAATGVEVSLLRGGERLVRVFSVRD